ncbi:MAG: YggS family pyridoxal phosphate-dependent enzyme [Bacteroidetes bacterium]|nr:YggS family pyridoxal phosphate-dependent enzyme [Bacteroidota bacterium]MBV6461451.1 Pyridoxal phosphate homeostasis protein [Flavobacteriales bacterium]WKZ76553.1 MAG: YggS family pyridoxal phosphate-dependent enzyme [Vicingaceae bacterium]MCL4815628.1 YggS family pyridoxal phosphate-dependent enzyme [Flavobacteriales bacterium]NOG94234.1 YggS family pyridoxal phosphate-dependent enzyme [Bacteroidota bacterium]
MISENLNNLKKQVGNQVAIVAVSKKKSPEMILEAYKAGHRHFGENYVQELCEKKEKLPQDICWHFIGHLQTNKVKQIAPFIYLIHGVDSFKLLKEINKQAQINNRKINVLLQAHIAQEETKFGLNKAELYAIIGSDELKKMENISILGLMGMASNTENSAIIEKEFKELNEIYSEIKKRRLLNLDFKILSMGMSSDYHIALKEGSNMLRIGSTIFGERIN